MRADVVKAVVRDGKVLCPVCGNRLAEIEDAKLILYCKGKPCKGPVVVELSALKK